MCSERGIRNGEIKDAKMEKTAQTKDSLEGKDVDQGVNGKYYL